MFNANDNVRKKRRQQIKDQQRCLIFSRGEAKHLYQKKKSAAVVDLTKGRVRPRGKKNADAPPPPVTRKVGRPSKQSASVADKVSSLKSRVKRKASGALAATPEKRRKWGGQVMYIVQCFTYFLYCLIKSKQCLIAVHATTLL